MHTPQDWLDESGNVIDEEDRGLHYDLGTLSRRSIFGLAGGLGLATLAGCAPATSASTSATATSATATATSAAATASATSSAGAECVAEVPDETAGPYPADGQSGMGGNVNVLDDTGIVRADIRSSFGGVTGTAEGIPLTIKLTVRGAESCEAMVGAAVYLWHCNRDGNYSLYSNGVTDQNWLRGVQATDDTGTVTYTSIFPGCYSGRWPHIHFEVYSSVAEATANGPIVKTSQIALPKASCDVVYATAGYESSVTNLSQITLATDNVFSDDQGKLQLATMSGDATKGYTAVLTVGV